MGNGRAVTGSATNTGRRVASTGHGTSMSGSEVVSQRSELTDSCPGCGKKHDSLAEMHACVCRYRMEEAFKGSPDFLEVAVRTICSKVRRR